MLLLLLLLWYRSNVGKSTLLNSLLGVEEVTEMKAAVSPKPGETRTLSFYGVGKTTKMNKVGR